MARPGVTREQVFEAADSLLSEGQTPTVVAVRTRLGRTGSPNTITRWLAEWREQRETKKVDALPPLPEPVESAMRQVWGAAWKSAQVQLEAEREALGNVRKEIERERADMLAEIQRLDTELDATRDEIRQGAEALETERRAHEQTRAEVREAQAIATEREKRIEEQADELREARRQAADASAQASRLEAELGHARAALEGARADARREADGRAELAGELDQARREIDGLKLKLAEATADGERTREHLSQIQGEAMQLREAQSGLVAERDRAQADGERIAAELEREREVAKQAKAALDLGAGKIRKLEDNLEAEREARTAAERALADLRVEVATLAAQAAQAQGLKELIQELKGQPQPGPKSARRGKVAKDAQAQSVGEG